MTTTTKAHTRRYMAETRTARAVLDRVGTGTFRPERASDEAQPAERVEALADLARLASAANFLAAAIDAAVLAAHEAGATYTQIGTDLQVSKQAAAKRVTAARERMGAPVQPPAPDTASTFVDVPLFTEPTPETTTVDAPEPEDTVWQVPSQAQHLAGGARRTTLCGIGLEYKPAISEHTTCRLCAAAVPPAPTSRRR